MRCRYLSDLHLESQEFEARLGGADALIIAGDLCHARCLDPAQTDRYGAAQRGRALRFIDQALEAFRHVLLVPGNHDHYDGVFEETAGLLTRWLPGVTVLDDEWVDLGGARFFGSTLWSDFDGASPEAMEAARRGMGEYFFVKTRTGGDGALGKLRPDHTLAAHRAALEALRRAAEGAGGRPLVVISHHAPSRKGLNPLFQGDGRDGAYASDLEELIGGLENAPVWVHGHTHIARSYRIGATIVRSNALGFVEKGYAARGFSAEAHFDI